MAPKKTNFDLPKFRFPSDIQSPSQPTESESSFDFSIGQTWRWWQCGDNARLKELPETD